jgi:hypothetical protein
LYNRLAGIARETWAYSPSKDNFQHEISGHIYTRTNIPLCTEQSFAWFLFRVRYYIFHRVTLYPTKFCKHYTKNYVYAQILSKFSLSVRATLYVYYTKHREAGNMNAPGEENPPNTTPLPFGHIASLRGAVKTNQVISS